MEWKSTSELDSEALETRKSLELKWALDTMGAEQDLGARSRARFQGIGHGIAQEPESGSGQAQLVNSDWCGSGATHGSAGRGVCSQLGAGWGFQ